jgi:dienelactone hydrolase
MNRLQGRDAPPTLRAVKPKPSPELAAWLKRRAAIRRILLQNLGDLPPRPPAGPKVEITGRERRNGYRLEWFRFDNGMGDGGSAVSGLIAIPDGVTRRAPAVQYCHWHGMDYHLGKREVLGQGSTGRPKIEEFTSRGYVVMSIDAYGFGERQCCGAAGSREQGAQTEWSLFKQFLWEGRTLWGMMLRDEMLALDYLQSRPEVDPARIAAAGISMGSTRSWWLAALDRRIKAAVCVACLTHYRTLIEKGALAAHGIYYFVPNLLKHFDSDAIVSLIAPRPLLTLTGDQDVGSPVEGVRQINRSVAKVYKLYGQSQKFRGVVYQGVGHEWTPAMWAETVRWLRRWL